MHLSEKELEQMLEEAAKKVEVGAYYRHFRQKEGLYRVLSLVVIEATQEPGVVYQKEVGSQVMRSIFWMRPLKEWIERVEGERARFQKVEAIYSS